MSVPAGKRFGDWLVLSELGRGGMGAVYRVRHGATGAIRALKLILPGFALDPADVARFQREAEVLARVGRHPGIVRIHHVGEHDGCPFTVMELVDGRSLQGIIEDRGRLPPDRAAELVAAAADALDHVHGHGVVHRDLKPENVLVEADGRPRILDFGLALDRAARRLTLSGDIVGTPAYMAPEQTGAVAGAEPGPATDVYGLGGVLYAALTGAPPFAGGDPYATLALVLEEPPRRPGLIAPDVPAPLEAICLRALEKRPEDRYPSAAELAADLRRFLAGEVVHARAASGAIASARRAIGRTPERRRTAAVTLAVIAAIAAIAIPLTTWAVLGRQGIDEETRVAREVEAAMTDAEALRLDQLIERASSLRSLSGPLREQAEVVVGLADLAAGDRSVLRGRILPGAAGGDESRWRGHLSIVLAILLDRHDPGAALVLEAAPDLLGEPGKPTELTMHLAEGIVAGRVEPSPILVEAIRARLDAVDDETAELLAGVTARAAVRRLEGDAGEGLVPPEARLELDRLNTLLARAKSPTLPEDLRDALVDDLRRRAESGKIPDPSENNRLFADFTPVAEALLWLLPSDHPDAVRIARNLANLAVVQFMAGEDRGVLDRAVALRRLNLWPFELEKLAQVAPEDIDGWVESRTQPGAEVDSMILAAALAIEWGRAARFETSQPELATRALIASAPRVVELVRRHRRHPSEVPSWALAWLGDRLVGTCLWKDAADPRASLVAPARRVEALAALGPLFGDGVDAATHTDVFDLIERELLGGVVLTRNDALPEARRSALAATARVEWLQLTNRESADEALPRAITAIDILVAHRERWSTLEIDLATFDSFRRHVHLAFRILEGWITRVPDHADDPEACADGQLERLITLIDRAGNPSEAADLSRLHRLRHGETPTIEAIRRYLLGHGASHRHRFIVHAAHVLVQTARRDHAHELLLTLMSEAPDAMPETPQPGWIQIRQELWTHFGETERARVDQVWLERHDRIRRARHTDGDGGGD